MKSIHTVTDLDQALTCLQLLPEEDFKAEFADLNNSLVNKKIYDRREIIYNCSTSEPEAVSDSKTLMQLAKKMLSRKTRKKLIQCLQDDPSPTVYRTRKSILKHLYGLVGGEGSYHFDS